MNISDFIEQEIDPLVDEWSKFAGTRLPSDALTFEELADDARVLLLAMAAEMRQEQCAQSRHDKSQGNVPGNAPEVTRFARSHAEQRFALGFSLDHLVAEFRALRASVIRRWSEKFAQGNRESVDELIRFGESVDQALSESTSLYSRNATDSRNLLLGVLGHDLRAPLGVVHTTANYLLHTDKLDGTQSKAVARVLTAAERMKAMVNDILDFTQTSLGVLLPVSRAPADMGEIAENIVAEVCTVHPHSRIAVLREGDLIGNWDAMRIGQMLSNLVSNAVQHGERGKPVTVRLSGDGDAVSVQVHNEGPPIAAEAQKTLFTPLRHASEGGGADRLTGSSGLGLGLYITREIALAHGGSIHVSSNEQGTTFCAILPRKADPKSLRMTDLRPS